MYEVMEINKGLEGVVSENQVDTSGNRTYAMERAHLDYEIEKNISKYELKVEAQRRDTTRFVRGKVRLPSNTTEMGPNLRGYTQLMASWKVINPILFGEEEELTCLHEDNHSESEYVTRRISESMLNKLESLPYALRNKMRHSYTKDFATQGRDAPY